MSQTTANRSSQIRQLVMDSLVLGYLLMAVFVWVSAPSDEQQLNLSRNFIAFSGFVLLGAVLSWFWNSRGISTLGEIVFEPAHRKAARLPQPWYKTVWGWQLLIFLGVTFVVGLQVTQFSIGELRDESGFEGAMRIFSSLASPNWALLPKAVLNIIETIFMAFMATSLAIPVAFVLSFFAAKNIMKSKLGFAVYFFLRTVLNVSRSIEALVWAVIFSIWVGIGPFAGMLALMIHSIASLTKQYSEIVESVSDGPIEGIMSTGANKIQTIWYAIVPQILLPYISFTVYRWDINIRMATIIGFVGGGGIGTLLYQYQQQAMWPEVGTIILVIAFVVWFMDTASAYLREALK